MARTGPNYVRRQDIKAALKRVKADDMLSLDHLAVIWGVTKTRFVSVYKEIEAAVGWPVPTPGPKNTHLYQAREALERMLEFETRHDSIEAARQKRVGQILGHTRRGREPEAGSVVSVGEMAQLNRLANDIEERERAQRQYIPVAEVAAISAEAFALFSEFCADMDNRADPNGELPPATRARIRELGAELQLRIYREMRGLLEADANTGPGDPKGSRGKARRARGASARR